jgi:quercetin dioxygenase-like cupin family protein
MQPVKSFNVLGDPIDVLVNGAMSNGASAVMVEHVRPGGGPPPHRHMNEDETFFVLEGEFEVFGDGKWHPIPKGEPVYGPRGVIHTFRNSGDTNGSILIFIAPAGLEDYLEELSPYSPGKDMAKILEISDRYGITFHLGG